MSLIQKHRDDLFKALDQFDVDVVIDRAMEDFGKGLISSVQMELIGRSAAFRKKELAAERIGRKA